MGGDKRTGPRDPQGAWSPAGQRALKKSLHTAPGGSRLTRRSSGVESGFVIGSFTDGAGHSLEGIVSPAPASLSISFHSSPSHCDMYSKKEVFPFKRWENGASRQSSRDQAHTGHSQKVSPPLCQTLTARLAGLGWRLSSAGPSAGSWGHRLSERQQARGPTITAVCPAHLKDTRLGRDGLLLYGEKGWGFPSAGFSCCPRRRNLGSQPCGVEQRGRVEKVNPQSPTCPPRAITVGTVITSLSLNFLTCKIGAGIHLWEWMVTKNAQHPIPLRRDWMFVQGSLWSCGQCSSQQNPGSGGERQRPRGALKREEFSWLLCLHFHQGQGHDLAPWFSVSGDTWPFWVVTVGRVLLVANALRPEILVNTP